MRIGACASTSVSSTIACGQRLYSVSFTPSTTMEDELDAKPSIDGAVPTIICGRPVSNANTLHRSLITPPPTAMIISHDVSKFMAMEPSAISSGSSLGRPISGASNSVYSTPAAARISATRFAAAA